MAASPARKLMADRAYDSLKGWIQGGVYAAGVFLSERKLAVRLGMSKTPVKSALVRLEAEGFVRVSPQQGIVVREPSVDEVLDLFDLREAVETFAVRRIAGRLTVDQVRRLRANLKGMGDAVRCGDAGAATRLDTEFHSLLCEFTGNREMGRVLWRMRDKLHRLILNNLTRLPDRMATSEKEHAAIAEAVIAGKGERAADGVRRHLDYGRALILRR